MSRTGLWLQVLAFLLGMGVLLKGFISEPVLSQYYWRHGGEQRLYWFVAVTIVVLSVANFVFRRHRRFALIIPLALWIVAACGIGPVAAAVLFFLSCLAVGDWVLGVSWDEDLEPLVSAVLRTLIGAALWLWVVGWMAHLPINLPPVYLILFALPVLLGLRRMFQRVRGAVEWLKGGGGESLSNVGWASLCILAFALHVVYMALPELYFDALAFHLRVATVMHDDAHWPFDFINYVWAVMPMGADMAFSAGYLLGGETAAKLVNFGFFLAVTALLYAETKRNYGTSAALIVSAAWISIPLAFIETATLWADNPLTAFLVAAFILLARFRDRRSVADVAIMGLLLGAALNVKLHAGAFIACFGAALLLSMRRSSLTRDQSARAIGLAAAVGLLIGAPSYAYAYWKTSNPIFPFYNGIFKSPYFDIWNFINTTYSGKFSWNLPYLMTFRSGEYMESGDGTMGFFMLGFLLLGFLLALARRNRAALLAAGIGLGYAVAVTSVTQYIRYTYPVWPLLLFVCAAAFSDRAGAWSVIRKASVAAAAVLVYLQLSLYPAAAWIFGGFRVDALFSPTIRSAMTDENVPERRIIEAINAQRQAHSAVLFVRDPFGAGLQGRALYLDWYNISLLASFNRANDPKSLQQFLMENEVTDVIAPVTGLAESKRTLCFVLNKVASATLRVRDLDLWSIDPAKLAHFGDQNLSTWEHYKSRPFKGSCHDEPQWARRSGNVR